MIRKMMSLLVLSMLPITNTAIAKPVPQKTKQAIIYGKPFYPSSYTPEMTVYVRNVKTGKTYPFKIAEDTKQYKMILPAPATYIFFSWTTEKLDTNGDGIFSRVGAVLSERDGSSQALCDDKDKHIPKTITLKPSQVIKNLQIANYYYPSDQGHLYVPKPLSYLTIAL